MSTVSVIIPTYNRSLYVTRAIDSVLAQSYQKYEIIVVDDGSTDNTRMVLQSYMDRIYYIYQENSGVSAARNTGLRVSNGEYIVFLDSDDYIAEHALEAQIAALESDPDAGWVYSRAIVLDEQGQVLRRYPGEDVLGLLGKFPEGDIFVDLFVKYGNFLPINAVMSRRTAIGTQIFDETLLGYEDWDFWVRLAANHKAKFVDEVLAFVTRQPDSAQAKVIEFIMGKAKVIQKIQRLYPERTMHYKRTLAKKAAGAHNSVASACLKQGLLSCAAAASLRSIKSHPLGRRAYWDLVSVFVAALAAIWSRLQNLQANILKTFKSIIPEPLRETCRKVRALLLSIGLAHSGEFAQPEEEIEASSEFSVIVAIHDSPEVTGRCLDSLEKYSGQAEVILVDDGSRLDETRKLITDYQQRNSWKVIRNNKPLRHSRACENGSKYAGRPYLCFLNSDTVVTPYSWAGVRDAFEADARVAVVGPATSTNTHQLASRRPFYCNHYWNNEQIYSFARQYTSKQPKQSWVEVLTINGFAFFIRNSVWVSCGGFHPDLPDYGNDTELCERLFRQGYKIILTKNSYIHHFGAGSIGKTMRKNEITERQLSAQRFIDKIYGPCQGKD